MTKKIQKFTKSIIVPRKIAAHKERMKRVSPQNLMKTSKSEAPKKRPVRGKDASRDKTENCKDLENIPEEIQVQEENYGSQN
jgi:hypothetical protein